MGSSVFYVIDTPRIHAPLGSGKDRPLHPNPTFRKTASDAALAFAKQRAFGMLTINADPAPLVAHIPFRVTDDGTGLEAHLVRSNPIWRAIENPTPAKLAIQGPDAFVSPDWYGVPDQVPTWNYIAVHITGTLRRLPQPELHGILERLSAEMEGRIEGKTPWTMNKMSPDVLDKMQRQIVPIAFDIEDIQSTWKLNQNKPDAVIANAIAGISENPMGSDVETLLTEMRKL